MIDSSHLNFACPYDASHIVKYPKYGYPNAIRGPQRSRLDLLEWNESLAKFPQPI